MQLKSVKIGWIGIIVGAMLMSCTANVPDGDRPLSSQSTIKIGGSSEAYPLLELLADAYEQQQDNVEIVFMPSSQSRGGLSSLRDNVIDIGAISRPLTPTEKTEALQYLPLVRNPLVLIVNQQVKDLNNLSSDAIKQIYSGLITNWKQLGSVDGEIVIIDIPEDETDKQLLRKHYLGQDLKITPQAILFEEDEEVLEGVAIIPYSIGVIAQSQKLKEFPVTILTLDRIDPTIDNIQNGNYKMIQIIGIVFPDRVQPATEDFINFISTPEAQEILKSNGYVFFNAESQSP